MTEPQHEYQSLDELFRKTFDNLPDSPDASGWDAPSDQVWQHVRTQIKPPKTGWSIQSIGLVSAFGVALTLGLYLFFGRPAAEPLPVPAATTPMEIPAPAATPPTEITTPHLPDVSKEVTTPPVTPAPANAAKQRPAPAAPNQPDNSTRQDNTTMQRPTGAVPLPGSKPPASRNSAEKKENIKDSTGGN